MPEHELEPRMRAMEVGQATLTQVVQDYSTNVGNLVTKHDKILMGTGAKDAPGLISRVESEETKSKNITRLIWILVSSAVGLGATYAASTLF